ncbi:MAG: tubulin-like doman-containing protein [Acidobacteriota bacterium]|nr:tubulin-like doman-containing protein [Blastocatellia bacterium]MDW8413034.1 tubulin-like doman-containing protein [Acidobacteriota bacterium]
MSEQILIQGKRTAEKLTQVKVTPTLIIGLGGTGGEILLRIRKRFFEKYGQLDNFPIVSYLWIDTDLTEKDVGARLFSEQVKFSQSEKIMATIADTTRITGDLNQYPHIKRWFYEGLNKLGTMTEGAGQIRAYSRLGFFEHYYEIRQAIQRAAERIRNVENMKLMLDRHGIEVEGSNKFNVYIVCSIAGGTGSGMFLDTAFLVKDLFLGQAVTSIGFLVFPRLFGSDVPRIFANGYAALKELEYYSYEHHFEVEWPDRVQRSIPPPAFNYCYLIDNMNIAGKTIDSNSKAVLFNMLADNIFKDFSQGEFAGYKRGVRVNLDQFLVDEYAFRHISEDGRPVIDQKFICRYSSLGLAAVSIPIDRIQKACAYKLAVDVVDRWGNLAAEGFNAGTLTQYVVENFLPEAGLLEGTTRRQGASEQRHDILRPLLDDGTDQGRSIDSLISRWAAEVVRQAQDGVHLQKKQSLKQFLAAALDTELIKLEAENKSPDPQQWGDYARAVHFNKERLIINGKQALERETAKVINRARQSVGYAIDLLKQTAFVLTDKAYDYRPKFLADAEELARRTERSNKAINSLLAEIAAHERRSNWDGRKSIILRYDLHRFEKLAEEHLKNLLHRRVRLAAVGVCDALVTFIGSAEQLSNGQVRSDGLIGKLYTLGRDLLSLKKSLSAKLDYFVEQPTQELSLLLYSREDIEKRYYPKYLGESTAAAKRIAEVGEQILQALNITVMDIPKLVAAEGLEAVDTKIVELTRTVFVDLGRDFDVVTALWEKYQKAEDREARLRLVYDNSRFWLYGGSQQRGFRLGNERSRMLIGLPERSDPVSVAELKRLLVDKIPSPGDPTPSLFAIPDSSEIVFYSEVGGIPINFADAVAEMRLHYINLYLNEELHIDRFETRFADITVLDDRGRKILEEAHECFLTGVMLGPIQAVADNRRVLYQYTETVGLNEQRRILGIEQKALLELQRDGRVRQKLLEEARRYREKVKRDPEQLLRYYALLSWYYREVYPEQHTVGPDGASYVEQSAMCKAVSHEIATVEKFIATTSYSLEEFRNEARKRLQTIHEFTSLLPDGKRAMVFK